MKREAEAVLTPPQEKKAQWKKDFTTVSGMEVNPLSTPADVADLDYDRDLASPGQFPFTRGIHKSGYRGRLWTMRQFAGFGTAKQTNERFHYLLEHGQTGLSTAFHLPTLYGYDSDHHHSAGEVGKCGVAVDTLADMETIFDGMNRNSRSTANAARTSDTSARERPALATDCSAESASTLRRARRLFIGRRKSVSYASTTGKPQ